MAYIGPGIDAVEQTGTDEAVIKNLGLPTAPGATVGVDPAMAAL
jgi:hypothetical protein